MDDDGGGLNGQDDESMVYSGLQQGPSLIAPLKGMLANWHMYDNFTLVQNHVREWS